MSIPSTLPPALRTATPQNGSVTITETPAQPPVVRLSVPSGTLRLRAQPAERRHIQWAEDVVDNEGMGKKSSKVCCIYHKPREVGESSDESSSDSSSSDESDSNSEPDNSTARPAAGTGRGRARGHRQQQQPPHNHNHDDHDCDHQHDDTSNGDAPRKQHRQRRRPSPNAYEKMPKNQK